MIVAAFSTWVQKGLKESVSCICEQAINPAVCRSDFQLALVVEGRAGARGQLLVSSRYVVLPGGRRIDISADFGFAPAQRWAVSSFQPRQVAKLPHLPSELALTIAFL